ncbi:MAG: hypothetical protein C4524_10290 [Candidatus Zixiibacteriota bacterium]|nr:MAG: hypothetical protein C4524_10290 [candidate division Zixibacteria bacterium]
MWRLIKAELAYRKWLLIILFAVFAYLGIKIGLADRNATVTLEHMTALPDAQAQAEMILGMAQLPLSLLLLAPGVIASLLLLKGMSRERRVGFVGALPRTRQQIGGARIVLPAILMGANLLLPLWVIARMRVNGLPMPLTPTVAVGGLILYLIYFYLLQHEIRYHRGRWWTVGLVLTGGLLVGSVLALQSLQVVKWLGLTWAGCLITAGAALALAGLVYRLFLLRPSLGSR